VGKERGEKGGSKIDQKKNNERNSSPQGRGLRITSDLQGRLLFIRGEGNVWDTNQGLISSSSETGKIIRISHLT